MNCMFRAGIRGLYRPTSQFVCVDLLSIPSGVVSQPLLRVVKVSLCVCLRVLSFTLLSMSHTLFHFPGSSQVSCALALRVILLSAKSVQPFPLLFPFSSLSLLSFRLKRHSQPLYIVLFNHFSLSDLYFRVSETDVARIIKKNQDVLNWTFSLLDWYLRALNTTFFSFNSEFAL